MYVRNCFSRLLVSMFMLLMLDILMIQGAAARHNNTRVNREHAISFRSARTGQMVEPTDSIVKARTLVEPYQLAVKTNLLMDAALLPCLGAEMTLKYNCSVAVEWHYAWWKNDHSYRYWQTYGGDIAFRRWFTQGCRPFTGHHVGLYLQTLTYDFEFGNKGNQSDKWTFGGGLEYGFSLPIARRLNLDFCFGLGYVAGSYKEYLPQDGHYVWQATKQRHWLGPTKAEISLVWNLGDLFHWGKGVKP